MRDRQDIGPNIRVNTSVSFLTRSDNPCRINPPWDGQELGINWAPAPDRRPITHAKVVDIGSEDILIAIGLDFIPADPNALRYAGVIISDQIGPIRVLTASSQTPPKDYTLCPDEKLPEDTLPPRILRFSPRRHGSIRF